MQDDLRSDGANISLSDIKKGLKKGVLMLEGELRQTLSAKKNMAERYA
jgi:hypothetical protein